MSTHFLAEEFPGNFIGRDQSRAEAWQCMAVAVALHHEQIERQFAANGRLAAREQENGARYVICDAEKCLNCHIVPMPQGDFVTIGHLVFIVKRDTHLADPVWRGTVNNMPHIMQLDRRGAGYNLRRRGAVIDIEIYAPHMAPFAALMPKRDAVHGARQLLAPMPGLLTLIAVKQGQQVKAGQELAVVEAMKMENILRAERDGTVGKIHAKAGSSLTVDQIILEFE